MVSHSTSGRRPDDDPRVARLLEIKPKLLRMLTARGVPEEIAEELFQDAFLIYWESNVEPKRLRRWFAGVLQHLAADWFRRRQRRARIFTVNAADRPDLVTRPPRIDIERILGGLDPADRKLLISLNIEGLSADELAQRLHTTPSNIWKRVSRVKLTLRRKKRRNHVRNPPPQTT